MSDSGLLHRLALVVAVLVLAGCGATTASPSSAPESPPTFGPESAPTFGRESAPTFDPVSYHADPDLERRLPSNVGGIEMLTRSYGPSDATAADDALAAALAAAGHGIGDLKTAVAFPADDSSELGIWAFAVAGMSGADLLVVLRDADTDDTPAEVDLQGKHVTMLSGSGSVSYLYASGDVVLIVGGAPNLAEAAIAALS